MKISNSVQVVSVVQVWILAAQRNNVLLSKTEIYIKDIYRDHPHKTQQN